MGRRNPQLGFDDVTWRQRIPKNSFFSRLHAWAEKNLRDDDFAAMYPNDGRPSHSPVVMALSLLIQLQMGYSDREMEQETRFDDRVKFALGVGRDFAGIDAVCFSQFRTRLLKHDFAMVLLDRTLASARDVGLFSGENVHAIDSFMVYGAAARQDTFTLIRSAILRVLSLARMHSVEKPLRKALVRDDYDLQEKPKINWNDPKERQQLLQSLVQDGCRVIQVAKELSSLPDDLRAAVDLLERVIEQDTETKDDGTIDIKRGTAPDRVISIHDPEMRHGRKTTSAKIDGYKTHLLTTGTDGDLIAAVEVTGANVPDGVVMPQILKDADARGLRPEKLYGDTAYFNPEVAEDEAKKGTQIVAKVPPVSCRGEMFTKEAFRIDTTHGEVTCPAGHTVEFDVDRITARRGAVVQFAKLCAGCPLRATCTNSAAGRTVRLHPYEPELQEARRIQQTEAFSNEYAKRAVAERVISHVTRSGGRFARYLGITKVRFQEILVAVTHNIKVVTRPRRCTTGQVCPG